ncbi:energy transducer TonB [Sphingomonas profundi]|uniref:energy transducer TonB n=1 Tax=Alterirhizorhabdus profundi TaxID=2681549 RepID=UPI0012E8D3AC|nr:energy transducer TonB [Sphingomonas profundi]
MQAAYARDGRIAAGEPHFRASFPEAPPSVESPPAMAPEPGGYGARERPNWAAIAAIVAGHAALLFALVRLDVIEIGREAAPPLVVVDLQTNPPPPPPPAAAVVPEVAPVTPPQTPLVAPPPIVETPAPPPPVAVVAEAPPPQAAIVAPPAPKAVTAAPVAIDLSTRMVSAKPPRYPVECRRNKEQGTVVLRLLLGIDGSVADIAVARSSGFDRLDKAALEAVRRWRWSPTVQGGQAVQVRGMVEIPFVLQA